jgi:phosphoglycolate phosphatase
MKLKYKAVVFDLDGTLVDSHEDLGDAMNGALEENGLQTHPYEKYKEMIGNGVQILAKRAVGENRPELVGRVLESMRKRYSQNAFNKTKAYPGLESLVKELKEMGMKLAVLTNKDDAFAAKVVEYYYGKGVFTIIWGAEPGRAIKPDPAALRELLAKLGVKSQDAIFVGDSGVDMDVAVACGVTAIGVTWGFRGREELIEHGAQRIVDNAQELIRELT